MFALSKQTARLYPVTTLRNVKINFSQISGDLTTGPKKGVAVGGFLRDAENTYGRKEAAKEEEYFYKQQQKLLYKLKHDQIGQAEFHRKQIAELEAAVQRHRESLAKMRE